MFRSSRQLIQCLSPATCPPRPRGEAGPLGEDRTVPLRAASANGAPALVSGCRVAARIRDHMCLEKQKYFIVVIFNPPWPFMEVGHGNRGIFHLLSTNTTPVLRPQNSRKR